MKVTKVLAGSRNKTTCDDSWPALWWGRGSLLEKGEEEHFSVRTLKKVSCDLLKSADPSVNGLEREPWKTVWLLGS